MSSKVKDPVTDLEIGECLDVIEAKSLSSSFQQFTCLEASSSHPLLICGSNTGIVEIYKYDHLGIPPTSSTSPAPAPRLIKALAPPRRSQHTNVKVTCVKLHPNERILAVGNILGAVNLILLDYSEGGRMQRMLHSHTHHQDAVRCFEWDDEGTRLFSGCDGGVIVETRFPKDHVSTVSENGTSSSSVVAASPRNSKESSIGGMGEVAGGPSSSGLFNRLKRSKQTFGPLMSIFQTYSSTVFSRENSEVLQVAFHSISGAQLPAALQREDEEPIDAILVATHARRCVVHFMNKALYKSIYSIQIEGGTPGPSSSGRTIYGAVLDILKGKHSHADVVQDLILYVSRPYGKLWKVYLGSGQPVETIAPSLVPSEDKGEEKDAAKNDDGDSNGDLSHVDDAVSSAAVLGGRLVLLVPCQYLLTWTPAGGLYLIDMENEQASCIWKEGISDLSVLRMKTHFKLAILHGAQKRVGVLEFGSTLVPVPVEAAHSPSSSPSPLTSSTSSKWDFSSAEEEERANGAAKVLQRTWREHHHQGHYPSTSQRIHGLLTVLSTAVEESRLECEGMLLQCHSTSLQSENSRGVANGGSKQGALAPEVSSMLKGMDEACKNAEYFTRQQQLLGVVASYTQQQPPWDATTSALLGAVNELLDSREKEEGDGEKEDTGYIEQKYPINGLDGKATRPAFYNSLRSRRDARKDDERKKGLRILASREVEEMDGEEDEMRLNVAALAALAYEVRLVAGDGLGLDLAFLGNGIVVRELTCLGDGRPSPAQLCGKIRTGDSLIAVNGTVLEPLALKDKLAILLALGGDYEREVVLRFVGREACSWGRPLMNGGSGAAGSLDAFQKNPFAPWLEPHVAAGGASSENEDESYEQQWSSPSGMGGEGKDQGEYEYHQQQRKWQTVESTIDLGLMRPVSSPRTELGGATAAAPAGPWETAGQMVVQQLLTSKLIPMKYRFWKKDDLGEGPDASRSVVDRKWGEFGRRHLSLGFVMAPEEMQSELLQIADDLRDLWIREKGASHSRFFDDSHFPHLLGQSQAESSSYGTNEGYITILRDFRMESSDLGYYQNLVRQSLNDSHAEYQEENQDDAFLIGNRALTSPRRSSDYVSDVHEEGGIDSARSGLLAPSTPASAKIVTQVYLEAIPLADVIAELGSRSKGFDIEEEVQDLDEAIEVLSRVLEATINKRLNQASSGGNDKNGAWPPIQLTHVAGMLLAVQHTHAIQGTTEAMLQEWLRCFTPLPPLQRHIVLDGSAFLSPYTHPEDAEIIHQHHRLSCEIVTLFFQMHTVWSLLEREPYVCDNEVRLKVSWGSSAVGVDATTGILGVIGRGQGRPTQWSEDEAMSFLEDYGAYIMVEGAVRACAARGFERVLSYIIHELAPREDGFQQKEKVIGRRIQQLLLAKKADNGVESYSLLVQDLKETEYSIALSVALLPELLTMDRARSLLILPQLCSALFPDLRPCLVRKMVLGSKKHQKDEKRRMKQNGYEEEEHDEDGQEQQQGEDEELGEKLWMSYLEAVDSREEVANIFPSLRHEGEIGREATSSSLTPEASGSGKDSLCMFEQEKADVSTLQRKLQKHISRLRRLVLAGDVMAEVQSYVWGAEGARRRKLLPPDVLGTAITESCGGLVADEMEQDDVVKEGKSKGLCVGRERDPVQGSGGLGVMWGLSHSCGVCRLPCASLLHGRAGEGGGRRAGAAASQRKNGDNAKDDGDGGDGKDCEAIVFFSCAHAYHKKCLPELACVLCLRENFASF